MNLVQRHDEWILNSLMGTSSRENSELVPGDPGNAEDASFLDAIPWCLDVLPQPADILKRTLRQEAARFEELPNQPVFSLLAVLHNPHPAHLRELILSCRCQSYRHWQLVLIEDGTGSQEAMNVARNWASKDSRILLVSQDNPTSSSEAKNLAVEQAGGDY